MSKINLLVWETLVPASASAPLLANNNSVITATARRSPAPTLANNNSVITATARR